VISGRIASGCSASLAGLAFLGFSGVRHDDRVDSISQAFSFVLSAGVHRNGVRGKSCVDWQT
jgi:hypothetical protein